MDVRRISGPKLTLWAAFPFLRRLRKVHFSGDLLGGFDFLRSAVLSQFHKKAFKFNKIPDFYKHPL